MISKNTAAGIALAHREIETAEELLRKITEELEKGETVDIRDAFGRPANGLQLGVPSGHNSHRLFNVPWSICRPIIETHIAAQREAIADLTRRAIAEAEGAVLACERCDWTGLPYHAVAHDDNDEGHCPECGGVLVAPQ